MSDSKLQKQPEKKKSQKGFMNRLKAAFTNLGKRLTAFVASMKAEIKRIMWPDRKRLIQSTATVIVIVVIAAVLLFTVDTLLSSSLEAVGFYKPAVTTVETSAATVETTAVETTVAIAETTAATN